MGFSVQLYCKHWGCAERSHGPSVSVPALPPDTPSVNTVAYIVLDMSIDFYEELAMLHRVVQVGGTECSRAEARIEVQPQEDDPNTHQDDKPKCRW